MYILTIVADAIIDEQFVQACVLIGDTLMANPIAGWLRGYCLLFLYPAGATNVNVMTQR